MRLIDADLLIEGRVENDPVVIAAKCVPTAYDPDKVVEQLQDSSRCYMDRWFKTSEDADFAKMQAFDKSVEIVKAGGVDG